ncbi:MAG TPA: pyridoxal phosphate-dependent aminotransferase [Planctomycetes bacterium]|nr:pyridoxal phosphate-dependent aminotransferase [Planctomycetota bacterium]
MRKIQPFSYMRWAKAHYYDAPISLVPSGMPPPGPEEFRIPGDLDLRTELLAVGKDSLQGQICSIYKAEEEECLVTAGSTQADLLAFHLFLEPGDEVLIESPAYGLFQSLASTVGAKARSFKRLPENDFDLIPSDIEAALSPKTKLVVFTTVHNPSARVASPEILEDLGERLEKRGIPGLASEVYLDFSPDSPAAGGRRPFAHRCHPALLSANSMTKVYGLGSVRTGWLLGRPEWIRAAADLREIYAPVLPAVPLRISALALQQRKGLLARARQLSENGRARFLEALARMPGFSAPRPQAGLTALVQVQDDAGAPLDTMAFSDWLRTEKGLGVVPGDFFGLPGSLRVGYGVPPETLDKGLALLDEGRRQFASITG